MHVNWNKKLSARESVLAVAVLVIVVSCIIGGEYSYHTYSDSVPDKGDEIDWYVPIIYGNDHVWRKSITTEPQIEYALVKELHANISIPRGSVFLDITGGMPEVCIPNGLEPVCAEIREAISVAESRAERVYDNDDIALVLLAFVRGIEYTEDSELYGCSEYWATPAETLWAGRGDCEDVAILFVTLGRLFGLETVLIASDEHVMAGVKTDKVYPVTVNGYTVVECTGNEDCRILCTNDVGKGLEMSVLTLTPLSVAIGGLSDYISSWGRFVRVITGTE